MTSNYTPEELRKILDQSNEDLPELPNFGERLPREITPPHYIKQKVGGGGLTDDILNRAQKVIEKNTVDFKPVAQEHLNDIAQTLEDMEDRSSYLNDRDYLNMMIHPAMQLKANGGMFNFPLVTEVADMFVKFLDSLTELNPDAHDIIVGFYTTLRAIVYGNIRGDGGKDGRELVNELTHALKRYIERRRNSS